MDSGIVIGLSDGSLSPRRRMPARVALLMAEVVGCRPRIWRRLAVKEAIGLPKLHACLQYVFGWSDYQTHAFAVGEMQYGNPVTRSERSVADDRAVTLRDLSLAVGKRMIYGYHFGEGWLVSLRVERFGAPERGRRYPLCLEGERAGPPEACGGMAGFHALLRGLKDPQSKTAAHWRALLGYDFEPDAFSCETMNAGLRQLGK